MSVPPGSNSDRRRAFSPDLPPLGASILRTSLRLAVVATFAYGIHLFLGRVTEWTDAMEPDMGAAVRGVVLGGVLVAYALLISVPFVPGIEVGISLMLMRGAEVAALVYLATVAGLILAFLVGRLVPLPWLRNLFLDLRFTAACRMLEQIQPLSPENRLKTLQQNVSGRLGKLAVRYRYLLLAGLINLPGSALIGGGGGICLVAGLTGLFNLRATLLTVALAVMPFPLIVWFWDRDC